jgi:hypothetical protein
MKLLGECAMWNLISVHFETVFVSVQYRCTVCAERAIGSEIILEIVVILTQDRCAICVECTSGLEIVLDVPDGTPR